MALSGTRAFNPNLGEIIIGAYARCGIRRTELVQQHMSDAQFEGNLLQSDMQGDGIQLYEVILQTQDIISGKYAYSIDPTTVFMLDVYIRQNPDQPNPIDRLIIPFSRSDYASVSNKYMQSFPTSYWYDKLLEPTMYLWPVPNSTIINGLQYYVMQRPQDAVSANGTQVQIPYEYYDYYVWALAERLAFIYAPERLAMISPRKREAYLKALQAGTENVPLRIETELASYYRVG